MVRRTFRSLSVRNYRLFFIGQLVSNTGTWMQSVAQAWLVLRLTGSGVDLGIVVALQFLPVLLLGVWGGVIADRVDKRRALLVTQASMAVVAGLLALVTALGVVTLGMVYVAAVLLGLTAVVDTPVRQAFVSELVGPAEVANGVALNSAMFNAARVVGPAVAAALIVAVGIWPAFAFNAVSFGAVLVALAMMRPDELFLAARVAPEKGQVRAGLRYVRQSEALFSTLVLVAVVGTFALNFTITMPLMARYAFGSGAGAFGLLTSAMGAGSMVGALVAAARSRPTLRLLVGASVAFGVLMLVAAGAPSLGFELAVMPFFGAASIIFMATANSILQLGSSPEMRGRVMALYVLVFLGSTPIGGPFVGWVAQMWGPRASVALGGVSCFVGAGVVAALGRRARVRSAAVAPAALEAAVA
jgi:MFS family permease